MNNIPLYWKIEDEAYNIMQEYKDKAENIATKIAEDYYKSAEKLTYYDREYIDNCLYKYNYWMSVANKVKEFQNIELVEKQKKLAVWLEENKKNLSNEKTT